MIQLTQSSTTPSMMCTQQMTSPSSTKPPFQPISSLVHPSSPTKQNKSALSSFLKALVRDREVTLMTDNHRSPVPSHREDQSPKQPRRTLQSRDLTPPPNSRLSCISGFGSWPSSLPLEPSSSFSSSSSSTSASLKSSSTRSPVKLSSTTARFTQRSRGSRQSRSPSPIPSLPLHRDSRWSPDSSLNWSSSSLDTSCLEDLDWAASSSSQITINNASSDSNCFLPSPPMRQFNPDSPLVVERKQHLVCTTVLSDVARLVVADDSTKDSNNDNKMAPSSRPPKYEKRRSV